VTDEHVLVICIMLFLPYFTFYDFASPINRLSSNYVDLIMFWRTTGKNLSHTSTGTSILLII